MRTSSSANISEIRLYLASRQWYTLRCHAASSVQLAKQILHLILFLAFLLRLIRWMSPYYWDGCFKWMTFQVEVVSLLEIKKFVQVFPAARIHQTRKYLPRCLQCGSVRWNVLELRLQSTAHRDSNATRTLRLTKKAHKNTHVSIAFFYQSTDRQNKTKR